jgi:hypothetical protein
MSRLASDDLASLLLDVARVLVAEGAYPSLDRLADRTGYTAKGRLCAARRELVDRGLWPVAIKPTTNAAAVESNIRRFRARWEDAGESDHLVGLNGRTPDEIEQAESNAARIRAERVGGVPSLPVLNHRFTLADLCLAAACRRHVRLYRQAASGVRAMLDRPHAPFDPTDSQITEAAFHAAMAEAFAFTGESDDADRRPADPSAALSRLARSWGLRLVGTAGVSACEQPRRSPRRGGRIVGQAMAAEVARRAAVEAAPDDGPRPVA